MPSVRAPHLILEERGDEDSFWLWRYAVDVVLWSEGLATTRNGLFRRSNAHLVGFPDAIRLAFRALSVIYTDPERVVTSRLTAACTEIAEWAEREERVETALQFAELAARLSPTEAPLCSTAGRLCRRRRELHRGTLWFRRATILSSAYSGKRYFRDLAAARFGWANLAFDLGNLQEAEQHATKAFRAALRCGRHAEAAYAYHVLAVALILQDRLAEAWVHAQNAISKYPADHPRFPALAHDIAFLWTKEGYFSDAADVFERMLPTIQKADERLIVLANIARAGAAAGDQLRYRRAGSEILRALHENKDVPHSALYHLARAAINAEEWRRAAMLASKIPAQPSARWQQMLEELRDDVRRRTGRDTNIIPEYGSEVYVARELLLKKLERYADPGDTVPGSAEKYPIS